MEATITMTLVISSRFEGSLADAVVDFSDNIDAHFTERQYGVRIVAKDLSVSYITS